MLKEYALVSLLTAEVRFRYQASLRKIFGGKYTETDFSLSA